MNTKGFTTQILHADRQAEIEHGSLHKPIHTSITFEYKKAEDIARVFQGKQFGYTYGRQINPTITALENKITLMEQGLATTCFSTGMAAISATLFSLLKAGDHFISSSFLFGNTNSLFNTMKNFGIEVSFVDATDVANVEAAIQPNTRAVFVETIANPCTQISDLVNIGNLCDEKNILYLVDNTLTSPYLFQPRIVKSSLVINSLSKYIGGHGNALGGSITEVGNFNWAQFPNIYDYYKSGDVHNWGLTQIKKKGLRDAGGTLDPQAAHRIAMGSETLPLRITKACDNADRLAQLFSEHAMVNRVYHPSISNHPQRNRAKTLFKNFGAIMSIELHESIDCFDFLNKLETVIVSSNLGDNRTLAIPVAHTIFYEMGQKRRASMGINDNTIRLSIGIEDFSDLHNDFMQALTN